MLDNTAACLRPGQCYWFCSNMLACFVMLLDWVYSRPAECETFWKVMQLKKMKKIYQPGKLWRKAMILGNLGKIIWSRGILPLLLRRTSINVFETLSWLAYC